MADYGHDLQFGTFLTPVAGAPHRVVELARLTEQSGLDLVTVQDHPYQARFLDTWTLLSVIAATTTSVRVSPNVANLPLRPPVVLARSAATLDLLSGGRVELGLGAGAFHDAIASVGGPRLSPSQAVDALAEGIEVIRGIWDADGGQVRVDGTHHVVPGAQPGPRPAHPIGIWLGAYKRRMLELTGRAADGWLPSSPYVPPEGLTAMNAAIDDAALAAGRAPADIRRLYNVSGSFSGSGDGFLAGGPAVWAEQLAELALDEGISGFILIGDDGEAIRRFAGEVVPAVRELVDAERHSPASSTGIAPTGAATPAQDREPVEVARGAAQAAGLQVAPTPDEGTRLSATAAWDETTRPVGPARDPRRTYTPHEQAAGRHLIDVHDGLRSELAQVRELVTQVSAGQMDPGTARSHINTMTMRQNDWTIGAYCEAYCRVVTTHHTLEDQSLFPHLRRSDPRLRPVIDRLEDEHHVIHDILERVDRALVAMISGEDDGKALHAEIDLLTDALLSHLAYEERELVEPIARLGLR
ncbi:LLM class flavin-dependent oxidoreductase [Pseudonocardia sp. NPDC049635]|uniref:LLM class flavin-dependent oxidoreductase n=1 Tax=Pseudonocardia sp. NPDC049635 TaxID=3155506 RepID=UPI0033C748E9